MPTQAQTPRDSVALITLPARGESIVLPRIAAVHYRNLVMELVPAMEAKIAGLEALVATQSDLAENRLLQIEHLTQSRDAIGQQTASLETDLAALRTQFNRVDDARKREERWKKFWKGSSFLGFGAAAVLGIVALAK
ncbi:MAG: hypothetical protein SH809_18685 [Rhodothermales bacterium]|nr:hypothetical protein [Rhodothermales bacterium]